MLTPDEVSDVVADLWARHEDELVGHDRVYNYVRGIWGAPDLPEGANDELRELARMSIKNVLSLVRDAFAQNLSVVGFRSPSSSENAPAWALWQRYKLDARQAEVHRSAVTYGASYAVVLPDAIRLRTPRQLFAVYEDPQVDDLPVYALDTWIDRSESTAWRRGLLIDGEHVYPVDLGPLSKIKRDSDSTRRPKRVRPVADGDPWTHGSLGCPVVRFVNARDAEDMISGEVEPLIREQRAINAVNFDRLVVSRYGAFPQKYVIGWAASDAAELARVSAARLMNFDEDPANVKVGDFASASVEPYNAILNEMLQHVAMAAQVPVASVTGSFSNLSADALAMAEHPHQQKLSEKRDSLGESWELVLRMAGQLHEVEIDERAEVVWRDSEARSFAQMVDGIVKLESAGFPVEELVDDVPGWSQQRIDAVRAAIRRRSASSSIDALREAADRARQDAGVLELTERGGAADSV